HGLLRELRLSRSSWWIGFSEDDINLHHLATVPSIALGITRSILVAFLFRDDEGWQVRLLNQFGYLGDIFLLDLRPFFQLLVELAAQHLERFELRLGWLIIARLDQVAKCIEPLVQHVRESQVRFRSLHVYLNEFLFDSGHFLIENVRSRERGFQALIIIETFVQVLDLRSQI